MQTALPKLTADHRRRGAAELADALAQLRLHQRDNPGGELPGHLFDRLVNLRAFLDRWPRLEWTSAWQHWQLAGRMPRAGDAPLPGADHASYWRVRWVRGPILATTFPYHWTADMHAEAQSFAARHGLAFEVRPADVPDLWFPGRTVPVIWSRAGLDWRHLGRFAAGAAGAAGGHVSEPAAHRATAAAGAAGAPQGVWGNGAAHIPPAAAKGQA